MGLDISAYSKIRRLPLPTDEDHSGEHARIYPNPDFPEQAEGIEDGYYEYEHGMDFRAGSYSGYNEWRNELARLAGYAPVERDHSPYAAGAWQKKSGPFWELINFADNEGCIGPKTSAKLAKDFAEFQHNADLHPDEWFRAKYAEWRKAFELAADAGAVDFS
jgi:hypothetical protein